MKKQKSIIWYFGMSSKNNLTFYNTFWNLSQEEMIKNSLMSQALKNLNYFRLQVGGCVFFFFQTHWTTDKLHIKKKPHSLGILNLAHLNLINGDIYHLIFNLQNG